MKENYAKYVVVIVITALVAGGITAVATDQSETIEKKEQKIESLQNEKQDYKTEISDLENRLQEATEKEKLVDYFPAFESENVKFHGLNSINVNAPTSGVGDYDSATLVYRDGVDDHIYYITVAQYEYKSDLEDGEQSVRDYLSSTAASDTSVIIRGNTLIAVEAYQGDSSTSYREQLDDLEANYN